MYTFKDTTTQIIGVTGATGSTGANNLPAEAVSVNGTYLENAISGYRTLYVKGRESIAKEIDAFSVGTANGDTVKSTRYPSRTISVGFQLIAESNSDFRNKFNTLNKLLSQNESICIFNDENDKYFIGTPILDMDIDTGRNAVTGEWQLYCADPFKYSTSECIKTASNGQFNITYNGTYKTYPTLITSFPASRDSSGDDTSTSQCGFVGFANQREHVLQFGDPNETSWADVTSPATVPINRKFDATTGWTLNGSQVLYGSTQVGAIGIGVSSYNCIYASSYGSGTGWHGPSLSKVITGESSPIPKNFDFSWKHNFRGTSTQFGDGEVLLWNKDGNTRTLVCGVLLQKITKDANCTIHLHVGSETSVKAYTVPCANIGVSSMKKMGNRVTFIIGGLSFSYANNDITDLVANEVTFQFLQSKSYATLGTNNVEWCKLQRLDNYDDVENIFMPGDVLTVKTQDGNVYLDDGSATIPATYLGALGNDWEDFYLVPGANVIGVGYSSFTTTAPSFTMKYRERFL